MAYIIIATENNLRFAFTQNDPHSGSPSYSFTDNFESEYIVKFKTIKDANITKERYSLNDSEDCKYSIIPEISNGAINSFRATFEISSKNVIHAMKPDFNGYNKEHIIDRLDKHIRIINEIKHFIENQ